MHKVKVSFRSRLCHSGLIYKSSESLHGWKCPGFSVHMFQQGKTLKVGWVLSVLAWSSAFTQGNWGLQRSQKCVISSPCSTAECSGWQLQGIISQPVPAFGEQYWEKKIFNKICIVSLTLPRASLTGDWPHCTSKPRGFGDFFIPISLMLWNFLLLLQHHTHSLCQWKHLKISQHLPRYLIRILLRSSGPRYNQGGSQLPYGEHQPLSVEGKERGHSLQQTFKYPGKTGIFLRSCSTCVFFVNAVTPEITKSLLFSNEIKL